jgi:YD repeat-containing protein
MGNGITPTNTPITGASGVLDSMPDKYITAPFSYDSVHNESINLNTGDLIYQTTDIVLPGVNGLDFALTRRYDSGKSMVFDASMLNTSRWVNQGYMLYLTHSYIGASLGSVQGLYNITYPTLSAAFDAAFVLATTPFSYSYTTTTGIKYDIVVTTVFQFVEIGYWTNNLSNQNLTPSNTYADTGLGMGLGWNFAFSSIETVRGDRFLHTAEGNVYKFEQNGGSNLKDYTRGDLRLAQESGGFSGASFTLYHGDGRREFFNNAGRVLAIRDRYDNQISFSYNANGVSSITDSAGRIISFNRVTVGTGYKNVVTLPDNTTMEYNFARVGTYNGTNRYRLESFVDQNGNMTEYSYDMKPVSFSGFRRTPGNSSDGNNHHKLLTAISYPNGASAHYSYEQAVRAFGSNGFEQFHRIVSRMDKEGSAQYNERAYSYSEVGYTAYRTNNSIDPSNLPSSHTYKTTVTDSTGVVTEYTFNNKHLMALEEVRQSGALLTSSQTVYNDHKLPTSVASRIYDGTAFIETILRAEYDSKGRLIRSWDAAANGNTSNTENRTTYAYDDRFNLLLTKTYKSDASTTIIERNTLTADGRTVSLSEVLENGTVRQRTGFTANSRGLITSIRRYTDGFTSHIETVNTYDTQGNLTSTATAGMTISTTYDAMGRPVSVTDGNGFTTHLTYDTKGNVSSITHPDGAGITYAHNYTANTLTVTNELGHAIRHEYNAFGLEKRVFDVTGNAELSVKTYDKMLRPLTERGAPGTAVTTYAYDALGRVVSQTTPLFGETYAYSITPSGLMRTQKTVTGNAESPDLRSVSYTNKLGFTVSEGTMNGPAEILMTHSYDYLGRKLSTTDPLANKTEWVYNVLGQVIRETDALNQSVTFTYDALGNLIGSADRKGTLTTYAYDALGRVVSQETPMDGSQTMRTSWTYDNNGNVLTETVAVTSSQDRVTSYAYSSRGFLMSASLNGETASYAYDAAGQLLTLTDNAGNVTRHTYDHLGRLKSVRDALNQTETYSYNPQGLLGSKTDRNGTVTSYTYDGLGRVLTETAGGATSATAYFRNGLVSSLSNDTVTVTYTYDGIGRLLQESESGAPNALTLTYNRLGLTPRAVFLCRPPYRSCQA